MKKTLLVGGCVCVYQVRKKKTEGSHQVKFSFHFYLTPSFAFSLPTGPRKQSQQQWRQNRQLDENCTTVRHCNTRDSRSPTSLWPIPVPHTLKLLFLRPTSLVVGIMQMNDIGRHIQHGSRLCCSAGHRSLQWPCVVVQVTKATELFCLCCVLCALLNSFPIGKTTQWPLLLSIVNHSSFITQGLRHTHHPPTAQLGGWHPTQDRNTLKTDNIDKGNMLPSFLLGFSWSTNSLSSCLLNGFPTQMFKHMTSFFVFTPSYVATSKLLLLFFYLEGKNKKAEKNLILFCFSLSSKKLPPLGYFQAW